MASLEQGEAEVARLRTLLDEPERKRADRYSFEKGRRQFTVARGLLRILLGRYLRIEPTQVQFAYNAHGKPALAEAHRPNLVRFNISHSGEVALFGFANERELGIDLETIRPDFAADAIAARFFAPPSWPRSARCRPRTARRPSSLAGPGKKRISRRKGRDSHSRSTRSKSRSPPERRPQCWSRTTIARRRPAGPFTSFTRPRLRRSPGRRRRRLPGPGADLARPHYLKRNNPLESHDHCLDRGHRRRSVLGERAPRPWSRLKRSEPESLSSESWSGFVGMGYDLKWSVL